MENQTIEQQAQGMVDAMQYCITGIKDVTVERHYWAQVAIYCEAEITAFGHVMKPGVRAEMDRALAEYRANAVAHAPVPADMKESAEVAYRLMLMKQEFIARAKAEAN